MKDGKLKKGVIIVLLVALLVSCLFLLIKSGKGTQVSDEKLEEIETKATSYIASLKSGYVTEYNGIELLYDNDKVSVGDLSNAEIINTALRYALENYDVSVPTTTVEELDFKGFETEKYSMYNGEAIRKAVKDLFGLEWDNRSATNELNFRYNFIYDEDYDVYLKGLNSAVGNINLTYDSAIITDVVETKKHNKSVDVVIAVAYVTKDNDVLSFYKDSGDTDPVYEEEMGDSVSIKESERSKFQTYTITFKNVDDIYVFDSISKN